MAKAQVLKKPDASGVADQGAFADQCIDLLCKQEKNLWLLGEINEKAYNDEALELVWRMLLQFLDFAEAHFNQEEFGEIAGALRSVHELTAEHKGRLNTRSWRLVRKMVGLESPDEMEMRNSYEKLGQEYVNLFQIFFASCRKRLTSELEPKERFDESVSVFLSELKSKW